MRNKITVILDTNVFDSMNYSFHRGSLKYLEEYIKQGKIELWIHNIAVSETKKHIKAKLSDFVKDLKNNRTFKNVFWADKKYIDILSQLEDDTVIQDGIKAFEEYLARTKARILDNSHVNIDDILKSYFDQTPPFSSGKKSEFPDAIMISSIKKELSSVDELHIIASDDDWRRSFENERKVSVYESLKDFLNFYNKQNEVRVEVETYFKDDSVSDQISREVKSLLDAFSFEVAGRFADESSLTFDQYCEEITNQITNKFEGCALYIEYIDPIFSRSDSDEETEGVIKVQIDSQAIIELECGYFNAEKSIWDPEEKEYIHKVIDFVKESHRIEFTTIINLKATRKKGERIKFYIDSIQLEDVPDQLTFQTLFCVGGSSQNTFRVEKTYKCPRCGKTIRVELIEEAEAASSYERQMGEEIEYQIEHEGICYNCLNNYRITGSVFEYPYNTLNVDNTAIEWENT